MNLYCCPIRCCILNQGKNQTPAIINHFWRHYVGIIYPTILISDIFQPYPIVGSVAFDQIVVSVIDWGLILQRSYQITWWVRNITKLYVILGGNGTHLIPKSWNTVLKVWDQLALIERESPLVLSIRAHDKWFLACCFIVNKNSAKLVYQSHTYQPLNPLMSCHPA